MKLILAVLLAMSSNVALSDTQQVEKNGQRRSQIFDIRLDSKQHKIIIKKKESVYQIIDIGKFPSSDNNIVISDYNFDGIDDIGISGDQGNVERFTNIYLFSKQTQKFERSESLSSIPCLVVDIRKKELTGECFHASSCENWAEKYMIRRHDTLSLIEKKGYGCDPSTNASFRYVEKYRNGRLLSNSVVDVK